MQRDGERERETERLCREKDKGSVCGEIESACKVSDRECECKEIKSACV